MLNTVVVGTDGTLTASNAGAAAIDLAERNGARLVLISSYRNDGGDRLTGKQAGRSARDPVGAEPRRRGRDDLHAGGRRSGGSRAQVTKIARFGDPAEVLCELAAEQRADVLVVGNKGMDRRLLGSVPKCVAHKAPRSVLVIKTT